MGKVREPGKRGRAWSCAQIPELASVPHYRDGPPGRLAPFLARTTGPDKRAVRRPGGAFGREIETADSPAPVSPHTPGGRACAES
jgi:hypothetical protein